MSKTGPHQRHRLTPAMHTRAVRKLSRRDPRLGAVVRRLGEPPLYLRKPGFATLIKIILEQQVSLASGRAAFERLARLAGGVTPSRLAHLPPDALRGAGLTRQKARYCGNLARAVTSGELRLNVLYRYDDEDCRKALMALPGIGRWTADVYLLLAMGRPDVWPAGDLALQAAQAQTLKLAGRPDMRTSEALAETWRPWRSVAARILWHNYLNPE